MTWSDGDNYSPEEEASARPESPHDRSTLASVSQPLLNATEPSSTDVLSKAIIDSNSSSDTNVTATTTTTAVTVSDPSASHPPTFGSSNYSKVRFKACPFLVNSTPHATFGEFSRCPYSHDPTTIEAAQNNS